MGAIEEFLNRFMSQRWGDLLLLHYPADPFIIQKSLPDDLVVDTHLNQAWFSVVAFRLTDLRIRPLTWLRWKDFLEVNLRTYVRDRFGNRGVWFYSLDSNDPFGVVGAQVLYGLRYNFARIGREGSKEQKCFAYCSERPSGASARIEGVWHSHDDPVKSEDQLDQFLLERYRFWAKRPGQKSSSSAFVRHQPYETLPLRDCKYQGELFSSQGFTEPENGPEMAHYCPGFSVEATAPSWMYSISGQANQR